MVRFVSLSSGSNGNCYYLGNDSVALLIDVGIGGRTISRRLAGYGLDIKSVDMVLVTHEHLDHIRSLGTFTEHYHKAVFATGKLNRVLKSHFCTEGKLTGCVHETTPGCEIERMGVRFTPFQVRHDAQDTVGYHIDFFGETFTFITDLGEVTDEVVDYCRRANHLIVESNYDLDMLLTGFYPPELKHRIMTGHGHLSNDQTAGLLRRCYHPGLESVFLCHLSENNNTPTKAVSSAAGALRSVGAPDDLLLCALPRREASQLFVFGK
ncbi:MAG: MBL fold metallo-hydrolase [Bacteroidales bacterium]|nr:MBL fold metallo-hydrolase [Bacteroidales bacterium]